MTTMSRGQKAAQTRQANKKRAERMARVDAACKSEIQEVNLKIQRSHRLIVIKTGFGLYILDGVSPRFDYTTHPDGSNPHWINTRTFMGCNDGTWADIMRQAGVPRHQMFERFS